MPAELQIGVEVLAAGEVLEVARDPSTRAVAPKMLTKLIEPVGDRSDAEEGDAWGIAAVGADTSAYSGDGVVVAVLDTGIDRDHPAFAGMELIERDFGGSGNGDRRGHGTHCAGTIFGRDVDGNRIGVAPGIRKALIGKVFPDVGGGDSLMVVDAINWAVREGADVISMSLGWDFAGEVHVLTGEGWPIDLATSHVLWKYRATLGVFDTVISSVRAMAPLELDAVVVAAAGNDSRRDLAPWYDLPASLPAAAQGVLAVGALQLEGAHLSVAPFSNTFPNLAAPGVAIKSAKVGGGTVELKGTSMACPHVAGVAALWWEAVRATPVPPTVQYVESKLLGTARSDVFAPEVDVGDRGAGLVRAP